jgi:hypothetical protein
MHISAIVIQGATAGGKKERLIAAPRENVWRWITEDDDDDERHYSVCLRSTLYVSEEETRNPNLCVFVQQGQITNSEEPLREFWMNEEKGFILEEMGFRPFRFGQLFLCPEP